MAKTKKNKSKYTEQQHNTLIACAIIILTYLVLALIIEPRSFWTFGTIHAALATGTIIFIYLGGARKAITRVILFLSFVGAGTALMLILYYLAIVSSLANK